MVFRRLNKARFHREWFLEDLLPSIIHVVDFCIQLLFVLVSLLFNRIKSLLLRIILSIDVSQLLIKKLLSLLILLIELLLIIVDHFKDLTNFSISCRRLLAKESTSG